MDEQMGTIDRDPVCGMTVDLAAGKPRAEHGDRTFHFCSEGCRSRFVADPERFIVATDPVCGMAVDRASARHTLVHGGARQYFCSARCLERFEAEPARFDGAAPLTAMPPAPPGTIYTCPMHPEIEQVGPGSCPICGMALEPKGVPPADAGSR